MNIRQMNTQIKDLLEQAKTLSEDERILLADLLYAESSLSTEENDEMEAENSDVAMARLRQKYQLK